MWIFQQSQSAAAAYKSSLYNPANLQLAMQAAAAAAAASPGSGQMHQQLSNSSSGSGASKKQSNLSNSAAGNKSSSSSHYSAASLAGQGLTNHNQNYLSSNASGGGGGGNSGTSSHNNNGTGGYKESAKSTTMSMGGYGEMREIGFDWKLGFNWIWVLYWKTGSNSATLNAMLSNPQFSGSLSSLQSQLNAAADMNALLNSAAKSKDYATSSGILR